MPAAFRGKEVKPHDYRRAAREHDEKVARDKERAREHAERTHMSRVTNFESEKEYPSLGAAPAKPTTLPKLDFKSMVKSTPIRVLEHEAEITEAIRSEQATPEWQALRARHKALPPIYHTRSQITTRSYDDGFEEYDGPEEMDADMREYAIAAGLIEEDDEDGRPSEEFEMNAGIAPERRRGDNGFW
jgi:hypothetical protein